MVLASILVQNEYIQSILVFLGFIIVARIFSYLLERRIKVTTHNAVLLAIKTPVYFIIISTGLYIAIRTPSVLVPLDIYIDRVFFVLFTVLMSLLVSRVLNILVSEQLRIQKKYENIPRLINGIIAAVIYLTAFLIILAYFNVELSPLVASLGISGIIIGLALQSTLSNFFAGVYIISDRPIKVGDFIELPGTGAAGYVVDIGWRTTRIKTLSDTFVIIPNSTLAGSIIVNSSLPGNEMDILVECTVAYDSDLKKVEKVTTEVAGIIQRTVAGADKAFKPSMRYHDFADSKIKFTVFLRVEKYAAKFLVVHEFIKALKEGYEKEKIKIA